MSAKALREKRAEVGGQIKTLADRQATWTAEDRTAWDTVNKDFDGLTEQIQTSERAEKEAADVVARVAQIAEESSTRTAPVSVGQVVQRARNSQEQREIAFQGWALVQNGLPDEVTDSHRAAAHACGVSLYNRDFTWRLGGTGRITRGKGLCTREARAAMGVSVDTLGGYTVPEGFVANLEMALRAYGGVRNVADIMRTETAQPLPWPTIADTDGVSVDPVYGGAAINVGELLGENVATSLTGTPPKMGAVIFGAQKFSSKLIQISSELLRDSAFNLASVIGSIIGERLGRIEARKFAVGSGNGIVPRGIVNAAPVGYTTAAASGITFDDLSNFIFSVDPAYRAAPGAGFLLHDKMVALLRLLKDGMGRYLWTAGSVTTGEEPKIWEYPYQVCQEMPYDISGDCIDGTNVNKLVLFGDLSKYKIREVASIRMKRLVERFAEYDQDGFIGYMEADGDLIDAGTNPVKALALA